MVGPARKQRKPTIVKQSGTEYRTYTERRNDELQWQTKLPLAKGTRKKPLLITAKEVKIKENASTKKTNERLGHSVATTEEESEAQA